MKIIIAPVFLLTVLMTPASSTSTSTSTTLLLSLLEPSLMTATCHARCGGLASEEVESCLALCLELLEEPTSSSLCDFPQFCTGGCRAACDSSRPEERRELRVSQQDCLLSWSSSSSSSSSLVFLVAGLDQGGMFSIVSPHQVAASLPLSPSITGKYSEMTVLAVDSQGLLDMKTVQIQQVESCPQEQQAPAPADFVESNLLHICLVVIISILLLTFLIVKIVRTVRSRQGGKQAVEKETLEDVYYSDNVFLVCRESIAEDVKYLNLV